MEFIKQAVWHSSTVKILKKNFRVRYYMYHVARKSLHPMSVEVSKIPRFGRGRPKIGEARVPKSFDYSLIVKVEENPEKTEELRLEAGWH